MLSIKQIIMKAEAFLLMDLRQSFKNAVGFICKHVDFHRKSQILKQRSVHPQGYPDTDIKLGRNIFAVETGFSIEVRTWKLLVGQSSAAHDHYPF